MQPGHVADVIAQLDERRRDDARRPEHHRPRCGPSRREPARVPARERPPPARSALLLAACAIRRDRVVLATARVPVLDGNLLHLHARDPAPRPDLEVVAPARAVQLRPGRQARLPRAASCAGMYYLQTRGCSSSTTRTCRSTSRRIEPATTVVQVWHAAGRAQALRAGHAHAAGRAGADVPAPLLRRGRRAAASGARDRMRPPCGRRSSGSCRSARRGPTSSSTRRALAAARERVLDAHPALRGGRVVLYAPTFRGRGRRQARRARARRRAPPRGPARRPCPGAQDPPEPRPGRDGDGRLRRRRRPGDRDQRPARADRRPRSPTTRRRSSSWPSCAGRSSCSSATWPSTRWIPGCTSTTGRR